MRYALRMYRSLDASFSSPEPVVSWSRGGETTGRLQFKPSGSGDENIDAFDSWSPVALCKSPFL